MRWWRSRSQILCGEEQIGDEEVDTAHPVKVSRWFPVNRKAGNWQMKHDIGFREECVHFVFIWKRLQLCLVLVGKNKKSFT